MAGLARAVLQLPEFLFILLTGSCLCDGAEASSSASPFRTFLYFSSVRMFNSRHTLSSRYRQSFPKVEMSTNPQEFNPSDLDEYLPAPVLGRPFGEDSADIAIASFQHTPSDWDQDNSQTHQR